MSQDRYTRRHEAFTDPLRLADAQDTIHQAVELLKVKHHVREASAYAILVQASIDARVDVRETARRMVKKSRDRSAR